MSLSTFLLTYTELGFVGASDVSSAAKDAGATEADGVSTPLWLEGSGSLLVSLATASSTSESVSSTVPPVRSMSSSTTGAASFFGLPRLPPLVLACRCLFIPFGIVSF